MIGQHVVSSPPLSNASLLPPPPSLQAGDGGVGGSATRGSQQAVPALPYTPLPHTLPYRVGGALPHTLRGGHVSVATPGSGGGEGGDGGAVGGLQGNR